LGSTEPPEGRGENVIEKCGAELTRHFPGRTGMKKHVSDEVIF
jgi:hypothetical protein